MPKNTQDIWFGLVERLGEPAARAHVAKMLRWAADQIDRGDYPDIFGCDVPAREPFRSNSIMETFTVTLSQPWPG